jgi:hypothetical protein
VHFCASAHGKESIFAMRFWPGARQRASHAVSPRRRQLLFFPVRREKTHGKDYLPCVVRRGARLRGFTVQNATVCPFPCAQMENARQRVYRVFYDLCRAPVAKPLFPIVKTGVAVPYPAPCGEGDPNVCHANRSDKHEVSYHMSFSI